MFITPSFKKSLIVEQFQGNYLKQYLTRPNLACSVAKTDLFRFWCSTRPFQIKIDIKTHLNEKTWKVKVTLNLKQPNTWKTAFFFTKNWLK